MLIPRQAVGDVVIIAFVGHVDMHALVRAGWRLERAHGDRDQVLVDGSQNSEEPQVEQNPRRTFSEERYQVRYSPPSIVNAERGTSVDAQ